MLVYGMVSGELLVQIKGGWVSMYCTVVCVVTSTSQTDTAATLLPIGRIVQLLLTARCEHLDGSLHLVA